MALEWNWLCVPYLVCALSLAAVWLVAGLVRGDRVLRLGTIGAATTTMPWALCSAVVTCTSDPDLATRLLRLGSAPIALVGPCLLLVLLGVSGQLENHRYLARFSGAVGLVLMALCWATDWTVVGVHVIPAGTLYLDPGPLTAIHFAQIGVWLGVGILIARRATAAGPEKRRMMHMLIAVLALGTIGASDLLLVYGIAGWFPVAWLPATIAAAVALYFELRSDLLRPQGFDRGVLIELVGFAATIAIIGAIIFTVRGWSPVAVATVTSIVWVTTLGISWTLTREQPVRVARERALEELVASLGDVEAEVQIAERLTALWKEVSIDVRALFRVETQDGQPILVDVMRGETRALDPELAVWLVESGELLAAGDLGTMRVGSIRPKLEALFVSGASRANLVVPLADRGVLVGLIEADHGGALREDERGLIDESARAAARALTYVALSGAAARERETAREVEVAEAMRLQASASRDDELGQWTVAAEYRTAIRTTGAGWSANLLHDGRLAVLVTEAQAHGVAAALATAALTGAFAASTTTRDAITLDDLLTSLRASAEGVVRGGEPVAAFIAILDAEAHTITWASAGHPGGAVIGPVAHDIMLAQGSITGPRPKSIMLGGGGARLGASLIVATRGETRFTADALLVVASTAVRGDDEHRWAVLLRDHSPAGSRLASTLVEIAARTGLPQEDLLAVVVRQRPDRHSARVLSAPIG